MIPVSDAPHADSGVEPMDVQTETDVHDVACTSSVASSVTPELAPVSEPSSVAPPRTPVAPAPSVGASGETLAPPGSPVPLNPVEKIAKDLAKIDRQLSTGSRPFGNDPFGPDLSHCE